MRPRFLSAFIFVLGTRTSHATCSVQCVDAIDAKDDSSYEKCVKDCEDIAIAVAASNGGIPSGPPPPCFGDLVSCGLTGIPSRSANAAEEMSKQISGCMFLKVAMNQLSPECGQEVDKVGKDKIVECVGMATDLCGTPDPAELSALKAAATASSVGNVPDTVLCMASALPSIEKQDATCGDLVSKFIQISAFAKAAADNANSALHQHGGGGGGGGYGVETGEEIEDVSEAEEVAAGVFGGIAFAVLAGAVCTTLGLVKGCHWASQKYKYGTLNQYEDALEMTEQDDIGMDEDFGDDDEYDQEDI